MCLGALVDVGVPLTYLSEQLAHLGIQGEFQLRSEIVHHNGQAATKVQVECAPASETRHHRDADADSASGPDPHPHGRHWGEIEQMIQAAQLPARAEAWSLAVFRQLAQAEGAVHGIPPEQVHFHEVGAVDAIVDIVGTCLGLDWLGVEYLYCSALPTGGGTTWAAHGRLPIPAPAVLKLWEQRQVPVYYNGIDRELVTPTGAALVTTLAHGFGPPPAMKLQRVGLGAGSLTLPLPNMVRLWLGEPWSSSPLSSPSLSQPHRPESPELPALSLPAARQETIVTLETQIDDLNPQAIGYLFERLFAVGALDVFTQAIGMKKSRPGILLTVICPPHQAAACEQVMFQETTTLGIRQTLQSRTALQRHSQLVHTPYGAIAVKVACWADRIVNVQPEYEDCAAIARQHQLPWREVHQLALQTWQQLYSSPETFPA
jgi:uncharacterized protein (TIGR00299 family) protein